MKKILYLAAIIISCACLFSCATNNGLRNTLKRAHDRAVSKTFNLPINTVFEAVSRACDNLGLLVEETDNKEGKIIIYAKGTHNFDKVLEHKGTLGVRVGIFITRISENSTSVEVVLQKEFKLDIGFMDYRKPVIDEISKIIKSTIGDQPDYREKSIAE